MMTDYHEHVAKAVRHLEMVGVDVEGMEVVLPRRAFDTFLCVLERDLMYTGYQSKPTPEITHFLYHGIRFVRGPRKKTDEVK